MERMRAFNKDKKATGINDLLYADDKTCWSENLTCQFSGSYTSVWYFWFIFQSDPTFCNDTVNDKRGKVTFEKRISFFLVSFNFRERIR